jgi:hypothetical protein
VARQSASKVRFWSGFGQNGPVWAVFGRERRLVPENGWLVPVRRGLVPANGGSVPENRRLVPERRGFVRRNEWGVLLNGRFVPGNGRLVVLNRRSVPADARLGAGVFAPFPEKRLACGPRGGRTSAFQILTGGIVGV